MDGSQDTETKNEGAADPALKSTADQNGTEAQPNPLEDRVATLEALVKALSAAPQAYDELMAQFETVKADVAALNSNDHGAPVQKLAADFADLVKEVESIGAQVLKLSDAAPPDAGEINNALAAVKDLVDFRQRAEVIFAKLRHMI